MSDSYRNAAIAWVRAILSDLHLTPAELARRAGVQSSTISRPLTPEYKHAFSGRTLAAIAAAVGRPLPRELGGVNDQGDGAATFAAGSDLSPPPPPRPLFVMAPEFVVSAKPEPSQAVGFWPFDRQQLTRLGLKGNADLSVFAVRDATMSPTIIEGDRILVDRDDTRLRSGGVFALWDGEAVIFRRVTRALAPAGAEPRLLVSADSQLVNDREMEADWLDPIGRAVLVIRRLPPL